ncbi:MAG: type II secretion system protein [Candidatus Omnitrophota bacterium]
MKKTSAYTLLEMIVVLAIFIIVFSSVIAIMLAGDRNWRIGRNIITEQQQARQAMSYIVRSLRQSSPQWGLTMEEDRILFYRPVFDANGNIIDTRWVIFRLNPLDSTQLIKSEQDLAPVVLAQDIDGIRFTGGCAGCAAFNCAAMAADCPVVMVEIRTRKNTVFTLVSKVMMRNAPLALSEDVPLIEPPEGEF